MTPEGCKSLDELIGVLVKYHPEANVELVEKAYQFAEEAHAGQKRKSGEPYFIHPRTVAGILADPTSSRATPKETQDYLETILAGKAKKTPEQLRQMDRGQLEQYVADLAARKK